MFSLGLPQKLFLWSSGQTHITAPIGLPRWTSLSGGTVDCVKKQVCNISLAPAPPDPKKAKVEELSTAAPADEEILVDEGLEHDAELEREVQYDIII